MDESNDFVKVTKTVLVPKGEDCSQCAFAKEVSLPPYMCTSDEHGCWSNFWYECSLYGRRLEVEEKYSTLFPLYTLQNNVKALFKKCDECLKDTKGD